LVRHSLGAANSRSELVSALEILVTSSTVCRGHARRLGACHRSHDILVNDAGGGFEMLK
jgi:hypothetical protein